MPEQKRATFEDVKKAQRELRNVLETLKDKNISLTEYEKGKSEFIDMVADACLGLDGDRNFVLKSNALANGIAGKQRKVMITVFDDSLGSVIREAVDIENSQYQFTRYCPTYGADAVGVIKIGEIWEEILSELNYVFPKALNLAVQISPERTDRPTPGTKKF